MTEELSLTETMALEAKDIPVAETVGDLIPSTFLCIKQLSRGEAIQTKIWHCQWSLSLAWFLRIQGVLQRDLAIFDSPEIKHWKPTGEILSSAYKVCEGIQNLLDNESPTGISNVYPYGSALSQWKAIVQESKEYSFRCLGSKRGKKEIEKDMLQTISVLKSCIKTGENPYDPVETPHVHKMIELSIMVGQHREKDSRDMKKARKQFRDVTFQNYVAALQKWKRALETNRNVKAIHAEGEHLVVQITGRQTTRV